MTTTQRTALLRWFLRARLTRGQIAMGVFYIGMVLHASLSPIRAAGPAGRLEALNVLLVFVWPAWLIDESFRFQGPVRLFIAPRGRHTAVAKHYVASRVLFATAVAALSLLAGLNTTIASLPSAWTFRLFVAAVVACVFLASLAAALVTFVRGKTALVALYLVVFGVASWEQSHHGLIARAVSTILPVWCLSISSGQDVLRHQPWRMLIPLGAAFGWSALAIWRFRGHYR